MENVALHDFKDAREYGLGSVLALALISAFLHMGLELVEQVIDDVGCENSDSIFICESLSVRHNPHVKSKNCGELLLDMLSLKGLHSLQDVLSVNRSDVN